MSARWARHGAEPERSLMWFYVTLGSGVGGGLVTGGRIYHGAPPGESEIGHVRLDREGTTVESRCSGWAVDARLREAKATHPQSALARRIGEAIRGPEKAEWARRCGRRPAGKGDPGRNGGRPRVRAFTRGAVVTPADHRAWGRPGADWGTIARGGGAAASAIRHGSVCARTKDRVGPFARVRQFRSAHWAWRRSAHEG